MPKLTKNQEKYINKFSWGGFFAPVIMSLYIKDFGLASASILSNLAGWIISIIPRSIVGGKARKTAYLKYQYNDFEEFKKKMKRTEIICTLLGIPGIVILLLIIISIII